MRLSAVGLLLLALILVSCSRSTLSRYYYLDPPTAESESRSGPSVGVEMVSLPEYVDRESVVSQRGANEVGLADEDLWAEPLDAGATRVVSENLAALLGAERVEVDAWPVGAVEYRVAVRVVRLIGRPGGEAALDALWHIRPDGRDAPTVAGRTRLRRPAGPDTASYVAALNDMFEEMSGEIAAAFPSLGAGRPGDGR